MSNLQHRQDKIKARRANTPFREFLMEIASRWTINLYRNNGMVSAFPDTPRSGNIVSLKQYREQFENTMNERELGNGFLKAFIQLFIDQPKPSIIHLVPSENSDFCHCSFGTKNAYLTFVAGLQAENIVYSTQTWANVTNIFNSSLVFNNSANIFQSRIILLQNSSDTFGHKSVS